MEEILFGFVKQGGFGLIAAIALWVAITKDKQVAALYDRLEAKSEKYLEQHLQLEKELKETVGALADALEMEDEED